jgi:hypothetical protein
MWCRFMDKFQFENELIARAVKGDSEAGREILRKIALTITSGNFDSPLFVFLADRLWGYLDGGYPLDQALCVKKVHRGGRPAQYDPIELAAVDILLRKHCDGFVEKAASVWIKEHIKCDPRPMEKRRQEYAPMEKLDYEILLYRTGSLRSLVAPLVRAMRKNSK